MKINFTSFRSLKGMIIIYFSFFIFMFMTIFGLAGYQVFSSIFMKNILIYTQHIIDESRRNIDSYMSQIDLILTSTAASQTILRHIEIMESEKKSDLDNRWVIENFLYNAIKFNPKIRDIMLISDSGQIISTSGKGVDPEYNFMEQEWFPGFDLNNSTHYAAMHLQDYYFENYGGTNKTVSAVAPVFSSFDTSSSIKALIMCNINRFDLFETLRQIKLENNSTLLLLDTENNIITNTHKKKYSSTDLAALGEIIIKNHSPFFTIMNNEKITVIFTTSKITNWKIIALVPERELLNHIKQLRYIFILIIFFILFIVIISYNFLNNVITKPIRHITFMMNKIEQGDFSIKINETTTRDTEYLSKKINSLVENTINLNRKIYTIEIKNKEAQIKALQSQINPHFFFNTLQSIKFAAINGEIKQTSRMITYLGNMLRYGIYNQEELVTIGVEISHLENFIKIQQYRFPELFTCTIDCPESLRIKKTIKLLLQPLVENTLTHNKLKMSGIKININVSKINNDIIIKISDTGEGVTEERLKYLKKHISDMEYEDKGESIGIKNVHNRIYLRFGAPYGVIIESKHGKGFAVTILIPELK